MPIVTKSFSYTSSRSNAKTLIHGGLGQRPLLFEELIHCKSYLGFIAYLFMSHLFWYGMALALVFLYLTLAMSSAKNHLGTLSNPKPLSPSNILSWTQVLSQTKFDRGWQLQAGLSALFWVGYSGGQIIRPSLG
jgi:hypothetical protein